MSDKINQLLSDISYAQHEAKRDTLNSIIYCEQKTEDIDAYNNNTGDTYTITSEGMIIDSDGDELFILEGVNDLTSSDRSKYDFIGHDQKVGTNNLAIAKTIREIFDYNSRYHDRSTSANIGKGAELLLGTKFGSNMAKYQKTVDLIQDAMKLDQNFVTIYYACDNIGRDPKTGLPAYVFFAQIKVPSGEYWFSWHLMRDGLNSNDKKQRNKPTPKNKICDKLNDFNGDGTKVIKLGRSKIDKYQELEEKYNKMHTNNKFAVDKLNKAFDL